MSSNFSVVVAALIGAAILTYYYDKRSQQDQAKQDENSEADSESEADKDGKGHFWLSLFAFLFPLFGFIYGLWVRIAKKNKVVSKICIEFAIVGFLTNFILLLIYWPI